MRLTLHKLRRRAAVVVARAIEGIVIVAIVLVGGLGSSWYMVEAGSILTTTRSGPWKTWSWAARPDADPYTRAHFVRAGTLSVSAQVQRSYVARTDDTGGGLHSSCDYLVAGALPRADWWSVAVFDDSGQLIANAADRYAFTNQTVAFSQGGAFTITLAREARAGNWLPTGGAGRLALVLTIADRTGDGQPDASMPTVRKLKCR